MATKSAGLRIESGRFWEIGCPVPKVAASQTDAQRAQECALQQVFGQSVTQAYLADADGGSVKHTPFVVAVHCKGVAEVQIIHLQLDVVRNLVALFIQQRQVGIGITQEAWNDVVHFPFFGIFQYPTAQHLIDRTGVQITTFAVI